jgi:hypothetical protein
MDLKVKGGELRSCSLGQWPLKEEKTAFDDLPFVWRRRNDLAGAEIVATSVTWSPISIGKPEEEGGGYTGVVPEVRSCSVTMGNKLV